MSAIDRGDRERPRSIMTLRDLDITGATAARLLDAFADLDEIMAASREELYAVRGVGPATVEKIERARAPFVVRVSLNQQAIEAIERTLESDDTPEETVDEWIQGAVRQRAMREFCR